MDLLGPTLNENNNLDLTKLKYGCESDSGSTISFVELDAQPETSVSVYLVYSYEKLLSRLILGQQTN